MHSLLAMTGTLDSGSIALLCLGLVVVGIWPYVAAGLFYGAGSKLIDKWMGGSKTKPAPAWDPSRPGKGGFRQGPSGWKTPTHAEGHWSKWGEEAGARGADALSATQDPAVRQAMLDSLQGRGMMMQRIEQLGQAPSAARAAAQAQSQRAQRGMLSAAAGARSPAERRAAMMAGGDVYQGMAGDTATAAAQEDMARRQAEIAAIGGMRGQDMAYGQLLQGLEQQRWNQAMGAEGLKKQYRDWGFTEAQANQAANMQLADMRMRAHFARYGNQMPAGTSWGDVMQGGLQGAGQVAMMAGMMNKGGGGDSGINTGWTGGTGTDLKDPWA